ncbi:hypothetical protein [Myroides sp. N17-2]|uniref:hypothetical protein n=1 Tax=Myroides sp. N17-2 TaxID=2030799 RepID=UPI000EFC6700|nr:hypothetical protein [Myroides sp. N17-2]
MKKFISLLVLLPIMGFSQERLGINTQLPLATLDVNGNLIVRKADELTAQDNRQLYIDNEGKVGPLPKDSKVIVAPVFFLEAENTNITETSTAAFNAGTVLQIDANPDHIVYNNLEISIKDGAYQIGQSGYYLVNSSITAQIATAAINQFVYVQVGIRTRKNSSTPWETIVATRPVLNINWNQTPGQGNSIVLPSRIIYFEKGEQLQVFLNRTSTGLGLQGSSATQIKVNTIYSKAVTLTIQKM